MEAADYLKKIPPVLRQFVAAPPNADGELRAHCPLHEDNAPSAYFNPTKPGGGVWYCHSCGGKGPLRALARKVRQGSKATVTDLGEARERKTTATQAEIPTERQVEAWNEALKKNGDAMLYLKSRHINEVSVEEWQVGITNRGFYSIPVRDSNGKIVNVRYYRPRQQGQKRKDIKNVDGGLITLWPLEILDEDPEDLVVCEGEWDCMLLNQHGIPAVTGTAGAETWRDQWAKAIGERRVYLAYDQDGPGEKGSKIAARSLVAVGAEVYLVDLALEEGKDVTDFFVTGGTTKQLKHLLKIATPFVDTKPEHEDFGRTELLLAKWFAHKYEGRIAFLGQWHYWNGKRWVPDTDQDEAEGLVGDFLIWLSDEGSKQIEDEEERGKFQAKILQMQSAMHMKNILRLSRRHLRRERPNSDHLFNTPAGTLDLNSMKLNPHKAEDYLTRWSETYYDPSATCPMWDAFIAEIMPNQKVLHYFQRCLGYAMHGSTEEQIAFFLHGRGANGKTTALETITSVLGDYAKSGIDGDFFSAKPSGGNVQYQDAGIQDARFVMVSETPIGKRMDESRFKRLVGGETITVSKKYVNEWTIRVTAKFFIATNHKPTVKDVSDGVWRRIQMIPFDVYIPLNQQDKTLEAKLRTESSGILNWLLKGYKEWRRIGLQPPPEVLEATQEYRVEQDTFGQFVTERLVVQPWAQLSQKGAYETYLRWCMEMGIDHPLSMITFGQALAERVKILKKTRIRREGKVVRGWQGIGKRRIK